MKRIILVEGRPGQGKSYLANSLMTEHAFVALSADQAYVDFIKSQCPILFFEALYLYIGPHYDAILKNQDNYSKAHLGRGFDAEWRRYLATRIQGMASLHDSVVVEGYLLKCRDPQFDQAVASVARLLVVSVEDRHYFFEGREVNVEEVAALGT